MVTFNHPEFGIFTYEDDTLFFGGQVFCSNVKVTCLSDLDWIVATLCEQLLWEERDLWYIDTLEYQDSLWW